MFLKIKKFDRYEFTTIKNLKFNFTLYKYFLSKNKLNKFNNKISIILLYFLRRLCQQFSQTCNC